MYVKEQVFAKMDTEIKAKWLAALRGGEFEQGWNYLHVPFELNTLIAEDYKGKSRDKPPTHTKGAFCCLGVVCAVAGLSIKPKDQWLPSAYAQQFNIEPGALNRLTNLNDTENYSFAEIADWIETNL